MPTLDEWKALRARLAAAAERREEPELLDALAAAARPQQQGSMKAIAESGVGKAVKALCKDQRQASAVREQAVALIRRWQEHLAAAKTSAAAGPSTSAAAGPSTSAAAPPRPRLPAPASTELVVLEGSGPKDYSSFSGRDAVALKPDAATKPFWVLPDARIILEAHSPVYREAEDLLIAIAEPRSRTTFLQEYQLTEYSLYAGASMGLKTQEILRAMERFSKTELPPAVRKKIFDETSRCDGGRFCTAALGAVLGGVDGWLARVRYTANY
jgi:hypothetical protein